MRRVPWNLRPKGLGEASRRSTLGLACLLALLGSTAEAQQQGTWQDTTYVDAIIRLDIENGPNAVVPALTYNTRLLLPLRQFAELAEIRVAAFALRDSATLVLEPGSVPLLFRPDRHTVTRGSDPVGHDSLDVVWWDGDLFVATALLDRLLGVSTSVEWAGLSATIGRSAGLPVVLRGRRERRRLMLGVTRPAPDVLDIALRQRMVDGAVATWSFTAARRGPSEQLSLDLGFGASLLGGSAELRPVLYGGDGYSGADLRWSWWKAWPERRDIRQLRIGDVQSSGRRSRLVEGIVVTNAPFIRSSEFDVEHLVNNVPAGWEAELYEDGRLLAYSDADAVGAFRVPLQLGYGQNPFELVLYGPGGETVRRTRTIRVPFSRLPSRRLEYSVAGGRCFYDPCDGLISADARYGLSSLVTVQAGWDAILGRDATPLWQPYAIVSGAPIPQLGLTGEAVVNGHTRAAANFEPSMDLRATAEYTAFSPAGARFGGAFAEAHRTETSLYWRPGWMGGLMFLQGAGVFSSGPYQRRQLQRLSATTMVGRFRYGFGVLHDRFTTTSTHSGHVAFDASAAAALSGPWSWLKASTVHAQLAVEPALGLTAMRGALGRKIGEAVRLDAGLGWLRGSGMSLELAFSTARPGPRFGARSRVTSQAGSEALVYATGSLAYDPRSRLLQLSDMSDLGRAGISGVLFRDDNANGRQDAGEPGLAGIPMRVGGWAAETDAQGRFAAWGMYPSEPLQIDVDTLSFTNPQLVLPASVMRVRPLPNAFGDISVPVVVGAEVSGFVLLGDDAVSGVQVVLRELNTGAEIRTLTYRDGGFYRGAVPPGEYEIIIPDAILERLHAIAQPLSIFVPPGAGEKRFDDLQLRLERLP